ncbi:barstar family protein [Leeia aquatica]|uniref:Barstar family protein n=1 Tax=Leeia aquatica TaxID=2725557 RepID=A0A847SHC0_9NEIS|nr:barstar family protein [Leeia aquatica]
MIFFYENESENFVAGAFNAIVSSDIKSFDALLQNLSEVLLFPDYFGKNLNALYDCLRDLGWIEERIVLVHHQTMPDLPEAEIASYVELLVSAAIDWGFDDLHELRIAFPSYCKDRIISVLSDVGLYVR